MDLTWVPEANLTSYVDNPFTTPDANQNASQYSYLGDQPYARVDPTILQNKYTPGGISQQLVRQGQNYFLPAEAMHSFGEAAGAQGDGGSNWGAVMNFLGTVGAPLLGYYGLGSMGIGPGAADPLFSAGMSQPTQLAFNGGVNELMQLADPQRFMLQSIPGMSTPTGLVTPDMLLSGAGAAGNMLEGEFSRVSDDPFSGSFRSGGAEDMGISAEQAIERGLGLPSEIPMGANPSGGGIQGFLRSLGINPSALSSPSGILRGAAALLTGGGGGGGGSGGRSFGLPEVLSIGSGLYGLSQSRRMRELAQQAADRADPFAPYRAGYAGRLQSLEANPSSVTRLPGYEAGLEAVQRSMAAQGYQGSGNMMAALQKYGGDFFNAERNFLAGAAGMGFNPANASQALLTGNQGAIDLAGRSLASIGYGFGGGRSPAMSLLERLAFGG